MRSYFQLFFGLLVPLSGLFIVLAVLYLKIDYDLTKAFRLGVLVGFFIAIALSSVLALFLLIMRWGGKPKTNIFKRNKKCKSKPIKVKQQESKKRKEVTPIPIVSKPKGNTPSPDQEMKQKIMLLMDRDLAFAVALYAINDQKVGTLTENKRTEGQITVKTDKGLLEINISALTRHTIQITIISSDNVSAKKVIQFMKQKEYAFLQY